jgi:hypothetical protein
MKCPANFLGRGWLLRLLRNTKQGDFFFYKKTTLVAVSPRGVFFANSICLQTSLPSQEPLIQKAGRGNPRSEEEETFFSRRAARRSGRLW